jgi:hypothetical protein
VGTAEGFIAKDSMYFDQAGKIGLNSIEFIAVPPKEAKRIKETSNLKQLSDIVGIDYTFDGIMGMSNIDESSGNLVLNQIWM